MYELSQNIWPLNWLLDKYCQDNNIKFLCLQQYSLYRAARFPNIEGILGFQITTLFAERNKTEDYSWLFKIAKEIAIVFFPTEVGRLCFIVTSEAEENKEGKDQKNRSKQANNCPKQDPHALATNLEIKTDRNPPVINYKPWPFELFEMNICCLRGPLRWLTQQKNLKFFRVAKRDRTANLPIILSK